MCNCNGLTDVYDTWWMKVCQYIGAKICVNNSFSGSRVTGECFPAANSRDRIDNLHTENYSHDLILIYIGFNDFGYGVRVSKHGLISMHGKNRNIFSDAYDMMLANIKDQKIPTCMYMPAQKPQLHGFCAGIYRGNSMSSGK